MTHINYSFRAFAALVGAALCLTNFQPRALAQEPPQLAFFEEHQKPVYAVALAPDGKTFLSADLGGVLSICDRATGKPIRTCLGHAGGVLSLAISPDGLQAASGGLDKKVRVFDLPRCHSLADIPSVPCAQTALVISSDAKLAL